MTTPRDELVRAAERRVLYAALWDRSTADELRATLPPDAFDGPAALVWALVERHDATAEPWPADGPATSSWSGPGRVLSVLTHALTLPADAPAHDAEAAMLTAAGRLVRTHGLDAVAVAPAGGWPLDLGTACRVLALAPAYRAAALALAQLDAIAHSLTTASRPASSAPAGARPAA